MKRSFLRYIVIVLTLLMAVPMVADLAHENKDYLTGRQYYQQRNYDKARYHLLRAVREDPDNQEALLMLVHIEDSTRHYATAIVHVNELLALNPYNEHHWLTKINLYRKQHNDVEADRLLERICNIYPENTDLKRRLDGRREEVALEQYRKQRTAGDVEGQIETLRQLIRQGQANGSMSRSELGQYYTTLTSLLERQGRTSEALDVAQVGLTLQPGNLTLIRKRVAILTDQGRTKEAYTFVSQAARRNPSATLTTMLRDLDEQLLAEARMNDAYSIQARRWERDRDTVALRTLISTAITRGYNDDALIYLTEARALWGDTPRLLYQTYTVRQRMGQTGQALALLKQIHTLEPDNEEVSDLLAADALRGMTDLIADLRYADALTLSDSILGLQPSTDITEAVMAKRHTCEAILAEREQNRQLEEWQQRATLLYREHRTEELLAVCDSALAVDSTLDVLILYTAEAHERLHHWDEALQWLRRYKPSCLEVPDYRRHINSLMQRSMLNTVTVEYQQARLGREDRLTANAGIGYERRLKNADVLTANIQYTARDNAEAEGDGTSIAPLDKGGVGLQLGAAYAHHFTPSMTGTLALAGATRYFPLVTVKAAADWDLHDNWGVGARASYRLTDSYHLTDDDILTGRRTSIFNIGATGHHNLEQWHLSATADAFLIRSQVFFNASVKAQYFPLEHSRTHLFAAAGAGTAPEMEIVDNSLPTGFNHVNTFVAGGGFYSFTSHLGAALSGSWYNLTNASGIHRNYFYINAQLQITF